MKEAYPELFFFYSDFKVTAERSDLFRILVLQREGGVYADMDMEPLQPLDDLIEIAGQPACMLGLEPKEHAVMVSVG